MAQFHRAMGGVPHTPPEYLPLPLPLSLLLLLPLRVFLVVILREAEDLLLQLLPHPQKPSSRPTSSQPSS
jgi:hypothetical protein